VSLDRIVQLVFNVYEAFTVALFVVEEDHLSCFSACTFAQSFDKARPVPLDGTLPGWAARHREPLIIGNFDKDEETLGYYGKEEEIKSFMAHPLDIPGVMVVDSKKKWVFTDKEKKMLAHFVSLLSAEAEREKELRLMEEEREELFLTRRVIGILREPSTASSALEEVLREGLTVARADMAIVGVETKGRLKVTGVVGANADRLSGVEASSKESIVSTMLEGGTEFLLPYDSGFLREKPFLFQNDGIRVRQLFGFPLMLGDSPYGFVGFVSVSQRHLKEAAIGVLRDVALLVSLFLSGHKIREEGKIDGGRDPVTGGMRFGQFFQHLDGLTQNSKDFAILSIRLSAFDFYNRSLGVEKVDDLLRRMHQGIEYCTGKNAIITRSGGGRFYVALKGADVPEDENILNILRFTVLGNFADEVAMTKQGIEIGAAYFPRDSKEPWKLMDIAKSRGKGNI